MLEKHRVLLDLLLETVRTQYAEDISLLIVYGSCLNGTAHERSDLDVLYIPRTPRGREMAHTFLLDGVGYDIWAADWELLERLARFEDLRVSILADSRLVWSASGEDEARYRALVAKACAVEAGPLTRPLWEMARTHLDRAKQYYGEVCLGGALSFVGGVLHEVCSVVCLLNRTYLHFGCKRTMEELSRMELPEGFLSAYRALAEHPSGTPEASCAFLIRAAGKMLEEKRHALPACPEVLYGLYEEIASCWNKIRFACAAGDAVQAFLASVSLQSELDCVQDTLDVQCEELELLREFDAGDLPRLQERADRAEGVLIKLLRENGIPIVRCGTLEDVRRLLLPEP